MFSQKCIPTQKFAVLGAHRNTIPAVWYDRCVTKCAVVKGLTTTPAHRYATFRPSVYRVTATFSRGKYKSSFRSSVSRRRDFLAWTRGDRSLWTGPRYIATYRNPNGGNPGEKLFRRRSSADTWLTRSFKLSSNSFLPAPFSFVRSCPFVPPWPEK